MLFFLLSIPYFHYVDLLFDPSLRCGVSWHAFLLVIDLYNTLLDCFRMRA